MSTPEVTTAATVDTPAPVAAPEPVVTAAPVAAAPTPAPALVETPRAAAAPAPAPAPAPAAAAAAPAAPAPVATNDATAKTVKLLVDAEFATLTDAQKAIVNASAGDDPNDRLKAILVVKATAASMAPKATMAAPAQTAPAGSAPAPSVSTAVDVKAEYQRLQASNPLLAAGYLLQNRGAYYKQP